MVDIVGYGTFIISHVRGDKIFLVKGVCDVIDYKRIFHPFYTNFQPFPYPFAIKQPGSKFKALLFEVTPENLLAVDHYEGVPKLYLREKCTIRLRGNDQEAEIYTPTKETWEGFTNRLPSVMSPMALTKMKNEDLWLTYLNDNFPEVMEKYPELFE